jgi:hypothetical protein
MHPAKVDSKEAICSQDSKKERSKDRRMRDV